ncbi:hypothetical protein ABVT39_021338 [Epinephelus coioides]
MDCRAVIILLLIAQAACGPVKTTAQALNNTIELMQKEIRTALGALAEPGVLPVSTSCHSLNTLELGGSEPLTAKHLSLFRCYMMKMSNLTTDVSHELVTASQYSQDVERLTSNSTDNRDCKLPAFEQEMDSFVYVKCLLEHLQQRLSSTTLGF